MGTVLVGGRPVETRFAVPSGPAAAVRRQLEDAGLGAGRARVAAQLGFPDPFHLLPLLAEAGEGPVVGAAGERLDTDAATAALVAAAGARGGEADEALRGIFAFRPPGPRTRALGGALPAALRWRGTDPPPPRLGPLSTWTLDQIGDEAVATVRCVGRWRGGVALGSDYGLVLAEHERFAGFPWPRGARREARRVEALAEGDGTLHVATSQALYTWDGRGEPKSRRHGADQEEGFDDLLALLHRDGRLYAAYRTRFEGGEGPPDVISLVADPSGVVYAGTRNGELHVIDGGGPLRSFREPGGGKPRPVRHLAWADGALFVAAAGALHRFDGVGWETLPGSEPGGLGVDEEGRLWVIREGQLWLWWLGELVPVPARLERPWALGAAPGALWIGGVGRVWRLALS